MINFDQIFRAIKEAYLLAEKMHAELAYALIPNSSGVVEINRDYILAKDIVSFKSILEANLAHIDKYGLQDVYVEELRVCVESFCMWVKNNFKNHQVISEWILEAINFGFNEKGVI